MKAINKGEYGIKVYVDFEEDVSSSTSYSITLKDPKGNEFEKTAALGSSTLTDTDIGTLSANEYVYYELALGDIDEAGRWQVRGQAEGDGKLRKTNWLPLVVKA